MGESKDIIPEHWPDGIKSVLNKLIEEDRAIVVDHMTRSYMAGYFDGEGGFQFQYGGAVPRVASQDRECLLLYEVKYGGHIGLQFEKGAQVPVYMKGKKVPDVYMTANRDCYYWTMTDKRRGRSSRGHILKTEFLLELLPYQHSLSKINQSIRAILALGWSSRSRWGQLIPENIEVDLVEDDRVPVDEFFK